MAKTLKQVMDYIDTMIPNSLDSTTKIGFVNDAQSKYWQYLTREAYDNSLETEANVALYTFPTGITFPQVTSIYVSDSTETPSSTHNYTQYRLKGTEDSAVGNQYYDGLDEDFGLYPVPDEDGKPILIRYQETPTIFETTAESTTYFKYDDDYVNLIKYKACASVAKAGRFPNAELANNYERDAMESWKNIKLKYEKENVKTPKHKWGYKDW